VVQASSSPYGAPLVTQNRLDALIGFVKIWHFSCYTYSRCTQNIKNDADRELPKNYIIHKLENRAIR